MSNYNLRLTFEKKGGERYSMVLPLDDIAGEEIEYIPPLDKFMHAGLGLDFAVKTLKRKQYRKDLFIHACRQIGALLAERMEDAEGWNDKSRIEPAKASLINE